MLCQEVMKRSVECLSAQDTAEHAAKKMRDSKIGFLPVCNDANQVVGTLTDRDLVVRLIAEGRPPETRIQALMSAEVISVRPDVDLRTAERLMALNHKSRILCMEGGRLVGVISLSDIADKDGAGAVQTLKEVSRREARA